MVNEEEEDKEGEWIDKAIIKLNVGGTMHYLMLEDLDVISHISIGEEIKRVSIFDISAHYATEEEIQKYKNRINDG